MKKNKEIFRGRQGQGLYSAQQLCREQLLTDGVIKCHLYLPPLRVPALNLHFLCVKISVCALNVCPYLKNPFQTCQINVGDVLIPPTCSAARSNNTRQILIH